MLRSHRRVHAWIWAGLAALLPLILSAALAYKAMRPGLPPNVQLAPAAEKVRP
jgi:hypothetical protein